MPNLREKASHRGRSGEDLRQHNLSTVLRLVHLQGTILRSKITATTGLNRSTVSDLVSELSELGLLVEKETEATSGVGRPSMAVMATDSVVAFSVNPEIDATTVSAVTLSGKVLARERKLMRAHPTPESAIAVAAEVITKMRRDLAKGIKIAGVGVSVPGQVRSSDGVIRFAPQLGWVESAFAAALSQEVSLPVYLGNDASIGCLAEARFGAAKGVDNAIFLFAGSGGIGGGVINNGKTLSGAAGYAGELGHIRISNSKQVDYSGLPGTLEALVRRNDLLDIFKLYVATDEELDAEIRGTESPKAKKLISEQVEHLANGISTLVNIFNPEVVVLGGFLNSLFEFAPDQLINQMRKGSLTAASERVVIRKGGLGSNLLVLGAAELPFEALINAPSSYSLSGA
ncbi:MAG: ROK family protein [Aquiluna sp.]|nr:ROK family protein [Aquiluna sp.]MCF8546123.1 ROK family protein [Aquiluna sp.]